MIFRLTLLLCLVVSTAGAMELGQGREAVLAQHGKATEENHSKNTATYRSGPWKVDVQYCGETVCRLTFTRLGKLSEEEIQSILTQNQGGQNWRELETGTSKRSWERTDLAIAECEKVNPRSISFSEAPATPPPMEVAPLETPATALVQENGTPMPYAMEHSAPREEKMEPSAVALFVDRLVRFFADHILVLVLPALILLIIGLTKLSRSRKTPASPARKVVAPRAREDGSQKTNEIPTSVDGLETDQFELLVGEIYRRRGYTVEISGGLGADGGQDLTLRKGNRTVLVQCKHWSDWKVSEPSLREFYGQVIDEGANAGIFVTSGGYTPDAREFAEGKPLELVARAELQQMIEEVSAPGENIFHVAPWVDRFAANARVVDPACPFCNQPMTLRRSVQGKVSWSCQSFPKCAGKREGRAELLAKRFPDSEATA